MDCNSRDYKWRLLLKMYLFEDFFDYKEEHYDISMKIGELVLFPAIRS